MDERTPERPCMKVFQDVCERQIAKMGKQTYRCAECCDIGLLWYPWRSPTTLTWWVFRCDCDTKGDWGVLHESIVRDRKGLILSMESGLRPWGESIPRWRHFRFKDGSMMTRNLLLNVNQSSAIS